MFQEVDYDTPEAKITVRARRGAGGSVPFCVKDKVCFKKDGLKRKKRKKDI